MEVAAYPCHNKVAMQFRNVELCMHGVARPAAGFQRLSSGNVRYWVHLQAGMSVALSHFCSVLANNWLLRVLDRYVGVRLEDECLEWCLAPCCCAVHTQPVMFGHKPPHLDSPSVKSNWSLKRKRQPRHPRRRCRSSTSSAIGSPNGVSWSTGVCPMVMSIWHPPAQLARWSSDASSSIPGGTLLRHAVQESHQIMRAIHPAARLRPVQQKEGAISCWHACVCMS